MPSRFLRIAIRFVPLGAAALAGLALVPAASCTFPTVDYVDASTGSSTMNACSVATSCATAAQQCSAEAAKTYETCTHQCTKPDQNMATCLDACASTRTSKLNQCEAVCESCGQTEGCANPTKSCNAIVGG